ncbi:radical SAM protein [Candidatus Competibacter phosphatis]|nr:radical SAM protein [Candidatus Competibacter phosphatis]
MKTKESPQQIASKLYLSIALLKECNYKCAYCHPMGESKVTYGENLTQRELEEVIDAAVRSGIKRYRFTGGECTLLAWFEEALVYALKRAPDVHVNICTNGSRLGRHLDLLEKYRDRVGIRVSLDSTNENHRQAGLYKILTHNLKETLVELSRRGIRTRFNTVITSINRKELDALADLAISLGFDLKLLDLYMQEEYIATRDASGAHAQEDSNRAMEYWRENYVDLNDLIPEVQRISDRKIDKYCEDGGFGIPMYAYETGGARIIFKDSTRGSFFHREDCMNRCRYYGLTCQEGIYTPHVSSNMILHVNGCHNPALQKNLRSRSADEMLQAFREFLSLFTNLQYVPTPPPPLSYHVNRVRKEAAC